MERSRLPDAKIENCRIVFRNFAGEERAFNEKGKRNFSIILEPAVADAMRRDGWNVKERKPKDDDGDIMFHLPVKVNYKGRPPAIYLITSRGRTRLDASTVAQLDYADITHVDVIVHPYAWDTAQGSGITAYVKTMFVTILEDDLEIKYGDVPDIGGHQDEPSLPWDED